MTRCASLQRLFRVALRAAGPDSCGARWRAPKSSSRPNTKTSSKCAGSSHEERMPGATNFLMGDTYESVAGAHFNQRYTWVLGPFRNNDRKHPVRYIGVYGPNPPTNRYFE